MNPFSTLAFMSALVAASLAQQYCTEPVKKACNSDVGASACITTQCSTKTSVGEADFKTTMIDGHNKIRAESIFGKYGANMLEMIWNVELADNALRWLQHLCDTNGFFHDENNCRQTPSFNSVGQNLFESTANFSNYSAAGIEGINSWNSEKKSITSLDELNPYTFNSATGHYTQIIWADTYLLGCAALTKDNPGTNSKTWVACNYAKGGNVIGQNTFQASDALATNCTKGSGRGSSGLCKLCRKADVNAATGLGPSQ